MAMRTQVKVCGITRIEDAESALSLGAKYIGINAYSKSPRFVPTDRMAELLEVIPVGKRVVVDVAPGLDALKQYKELGFDRFQFHFDLNIPMAAIAGWSELVGPEALWLAPRIPKSIQIFPQILMEFSETILLDTFDKHLYGGTGLSGQNWQRFLDCTVLYQHKRWILAGGLSPENVVEALDFTQAETIDLSSGVESEPGIKDIGKLKRLFANVTEFDKQL
jgi:phosphoribosylanthranilate isomerase